jgi:polyisoprenoid-binding protein YceI
MPRLNRQPFTPLLILLLTLTLAGCAGLIAPEPEKEISALRPGNYQLDPDHTRVLFKVGHLGLSKFVGRFNKVDASLDFDPAKIGATRLDAQVETASIDVNNPNFEASLTSVFWLNSEKFPAAGFTTESVTQLGDNRIQILGSLSFLGITKPLRLEAVFNGGAFNLLTGKYTLGFEARGRLKRSDFGLDNYIPAVGDEVELEIHAEFQRI